jgi:glycosyltransferase involved in cell wall biosynthesis
VGVLARPAALTSMSEAALSILMPSYNAGGFLKDALASVVPQLASDDEVVVQDGGSKDGSIEALAAAYEDDPRVKIVSEPDNGQSDALQRALARAGNPFIGWLNADDIYYPGALDAVRAALAEQPDADVVYGSATIFADGDRVLRRVEPSEFTVGAFVQHGCHAFSGATFLRTELVRAAGGFNPALHYAMDFDLFFRVADRHPKYVRLSETIGGLRWHDASKSGSGSFRFFKEAIRVRMRYAKTPRERLHVYAQMSYRLAGLPFISLRHSRPISRLRGVKKF